MSSENGESRERRRTTISIPESRLEEFKAHAEESEEYTSLSHFLRVAGLQEMKDGEATSNVEVDISEELTDDVGELREGMQQLQDEVSTLHDLIETVELRTREPSKDIEALQNDLFEVLPDENATDTARSAVEADVSVPGRLHDEYRHREQTPVPGWPEDLKEAIDATRKVDVVEALERMADTMGVVTKTDLGGEPWYFRRV